MTLSARLRVVDDDEAIALLSSWVSENLTQAAAIDRGDARAAIGACLARIVVWTERYAPKHRTASDWFRSESVCAVTAACCTSLCPGGTGWCQAEGANARELLLAGEFQEAEIAQAELLSGVMDVDVDFNWPTMTSGPKPTTRPGRSSVAA